MEVDVADGAASAPAAPRPLAKADAVNPAFQAIASERLREAAEGVAVAWRERTEEAAGVVADVVEPLATLARQIEELRGGGAPERSPAQARRPYFHARILAALRRRLLEDWCETDDGADAGGETRELLLALERLPALLWPTEDRDPIARLTEPDALELVVEMAHDLHSPLNSILFLAETIRSGHSGPVNELQATQLGLMYSAALRIMAMSGDVMELAKERRPETSEPPTPFSIREIFETVNELVRPMAEEKGLDLTFRPFGNDSFVGYPVPLGRVLLNLTTNALKFTHQGGVTVSARWAGPSEIEFSVSDTGGGIEPERRHLLFEPFQEATGREGHFFSVSGLGLTIARRLVQAMGSELRFETEVGRGTTFSFRLRLPSSGPVS